MGRKHTHTHTVLYWITHGTLETNRKLNVGNKQETVDLIEGDVECRSYDSNNRFIHVGVDISSYALLIEGRSSYPPCVG